MSKSPFCMGSCQLGNTAEVLKLSRKSKREFKKKKIQSKIIYFTVHKCMPKNLQDYLDNKIRFIK